MRTAIGLPDPQAGRQFNINRLGGTQSWVPLFCFPEVFMDVLGMLVWLSGAGISAVSAFVLERVDGFASLSPNGKQTIALVVAVLIAVASMWAHDWLSANPTALTAATPYLQIAITGVSILIQQTAHAVQRSTGGSNG